MKDVILLCRNHWKRSTRHSLQRFRIRTSNVLGIRIRLENCLANPFHLIHRLAYLTTKQDPAEP